MSINGYGYIYKPKNIRNYKYTVSGTNKETILPKSYMLPSEILPLVDNQHQVNSCVAHGIAKAMESLYIKQFGKRKVFSRGYIYGNPVCRNGYNGEGMFVDAALNGTVKAGNVLHSDFSIDKEVPKIIELFNQRTDLTDEAKEFTINTYLEIPTYALVDKRRQAIKEALFIYQTPLVIASQNYFSGGGHCVIAVGWDEKDNIIFQNSWGKEYKDKGYYNMDASYIDEAYVLLYEPLVLPFTDVIETDWYYKAIKTIYYSGIMTGTTNITFDPKNNIIRSEVATIGTRILEKTENNFNNWDTTMQQINKKVNKITILKSTDINPFTDVNSSEWYFSYVLRAVASGFMTGDTEGTFRPDAYITRAEFATTVVRLADIIYSAFAKNNIIENMPLLDNLSIDYSDVDIKDWYSKEVIKAYSLGIMNGDDDGKFRPDDNITRAEAAVTMSRLMSKVDSWLSYFCDNQE